MTSERPPAKVTAIRDAAQRHGSDPAERARLRADHIRSCLTNAAGSIAEAARIYAEAVEAEDWRALGFESLDAWREDMLRLTRFRPADRKMIAELLAERGMTQREIAAATGVSQATTATDLAAGDQKLITTGSARQQAAREREQAARELEEGIQAARERARRRAASSAERDRREEEERAARERVLEPGQADDPRRATYPPVTPPPVDVAMEQLLRDCEAATVLLQRIAAGLQRAPERGTMLRQSLAALNGAMDDVLRELKD